MRLRPAQRRFWETGWACPMRCVKAGRMAAELAARTGTQERLVREWLSR